MTITAAGLKLLLIALIVSLSATAADARRRKHRHYLVPYQTIVPRDAPVMARGREYETPRLRPRAITGAASRREGSSATLVPPDWQLQPADPNWTGRRFLSPDGAAWFAAYAAPAQREAITAHVKDVAFVEGEEITYIRGERTWIAVSGFKNDRIFYRKAVLACGGDRWHHIAFEYPAAAKQKMDQFVSRAAEDVQHSQNSGCETPVSAR